jgi:hypothetical protein
MLAAQPFAIAGIVVLLVYSESSLPMLLNLAGHLLAFFVIAMACHGELARQRPPADHLTTFYLALSAGGMIGGLFAGLIAFRVLMDRRVSDPARARRNLPADREVRLGAPRSCVLGGGRRARAGAARPGPRLRLATARG